MVVIDQFEQWLHAHASSGDSQLVPALRHCDGSGIQCVVLVRDDFWLSATRFMQALETPLVEEQNSALVDLFDMDHAAKVLAAFGRAYGKLPDLPAEPNEDQTPFLEQAVLADEDGKVVCVRLAVFAEMMAIARQWLSLP